jgi:tRNA1(Val) A37 N6-methylase TrmN6
LSRPGRERANNLADLLGWSLPAEPGALPAQIESALLGAGVVAGTEDGFLQPLLRVSRVEDMLFFHSAYPTRERDAVFLGPDSYRFAQFILARMGEGAHTILDYGAGSGVGGMVAARRAGDAFLTIADINPKALYLASINAEHAGVKHQVVEASRPADFSGFSFDLVVSHPPFMIDREQRAYRDGGDLFGARLSLDWLREGAGLLAGGGRLIMHSGSSVVGGSDILRSALEAQPLPAEMTLDYRELDPDIFGNELGKADYADVERIAAVGIVIDRQV